MLKQYGKFGLFLATIISLIAVPLLSIKYGIKTTEKDKGDDDRLNESINNSFKEKPTIIANSENIIEANILNNVDIDEAIVNGMLEPAPGKQITLSAWQIVVNPKANSTLRNNAANLLFIDPKNHQQLGDALRSAINNTLESELWRNYAIQHIGNILHYGSGNDSDMKLLLKIASDFNSPLAGTALLQLSRMNTFTYDLDGATRLDNIILNMASNKDCNVSSRLTAIGLIGEREIKEGIAVLRKSMSEDVLMIKRASIASIGIIGDNSDLEIISAQSQSEDRLIAAAAVTATQRLTNKLRAKN